MTGLSLSGDDESLLFPWFAKDNETVALLCQAVERQKAEKAVMVSLSLLGHPRLDGDPANRWLRTCVRDAAARLIA